MSRPGLTLADVVAEVGRWQVCRRVGQLAGAGEINRAAVIAAELCLDVPAQRSTVGRTEESTTQAAGSVPRS